MNRYDLLYTLQLETQMIFEAKESMWQTHQDQNVPWRCWEMVKHGIYQCKVLGVSSSTFTSRFFCHKLNQMFEFFRWFWLTCFAKNDVSIGRTFLHRGGQHLNKDSVLHCEFALSVFTFSFHIELLGVQRGWHTARLACPNWKYTLFFSKLQMSWRSLKAPIWFAQTAWDHNLRRSQISNLQNSFVLCFRTLF